MPYEGSAAGFAYAAERAPPPPVNDVAEQNLLGAIFLNNTIFPRVADKLREEHFGTPVHGRIYAACGKLIERGITASPITLKNRFDADEALIVLGGAGYLANLMVSVVTVLNAEHYAETIIECWRRRELIELAEAMVKRAHAHDPDDPASMIAEAAAGALDAVLSDSGIGTAGAAQQGLTGAGVAAAEALERSQAAYRGDGAAGTVMSGIESLDRLTGGFQNGDLIYIGKRPSMGGTAFVVTVGLNAARAGVPAAIFSAEMSRARLGQRMLAWLTGVSTRAQRMGALDPNEWAVLSDAQAELSGLPLLIDDTAPIGVATIRRRARQAKAKGGLRLLLIDYLQLIRAGDGHEDMPLRDAVPKVSAGLRDLAKELDVPVVCLAQLSPDIDKRENKRPMLSDIRWSHDAEQDAGLVAMIYREAYYLQHAEPKASQHSDPLKLDKLHAEWATAVANAEGRAELIVVKARDDGTGAAHCGFDPVRSLFYEDPGRQGRFW